MDLCPLIEGIRVGGPDVDDKLTLTRIAFSVERVGSAGGSGDDSELVLLQEGGELVAAPLVGVVTILGIKGGHVGPTKDHVDVLTLDAGHVALDLGIVFLETERSVTQILPEGLLGRL